MGFKPGDRLNEGTYVIEKQLSDENSSGFGITYKATDRGLNRSVVLKLPNSALCRDPKYLSFLDSFQTEAETLGQLVGDRHPHIVQVYTAFPVTVAGRTEPVLCMVMEYINGSDLYRQVHQVNDRQQMEIHPLTEPKALGYIQQIGSALAHLHRYEPKPIVHRDVKPANIMVREKDNRAVLIDFGLARTFVPNITKKHTVALSPGYAPPEQYLLEAQRGAYTDIYSLAATLYFLVTGQDPAAATDRGLSLYQSGQDLLAPPQQLNPNLSDRVNAAILWGMQLKTHDRPQSVGEWLRELGLVSMAPSEIPGMPPNFTKPTVRVPGMEPGLSDNWLEELGPPPPDPLVEGLLNLGRGVKRGVQQKLQEVQERQRQEQERQQQEQERERRRKAEQERLQAEAKRQAALEAERQRQEREAQRRQRQAAEAQRREAERQRKEAERWNVDAVPLKSEKGVDYTRLRDLLRLGQWKEADQETYQRMLEATDRTKEGWFRSKDLLNFPCADLKTIDRLWVQASQGRYGFSVQKEIYVKCGGKLDGNYPGDTIWEKFGDEVGWRVNGSWVRYYDHYWGGIGVPGHLPLGLIIWRGRGGTWSVCSLLSHRDL